jgi:hypothetical protein
MKDRLLKNPRVWEWIAVENGRQVDKWGVQDREAEEWFLFLGEEVGELAQAIGEWKYRKGLAEDVSNEAMQAAVLALKICEMFMKED